MRVRWIHAKRCAFYILQRTDIYFCYEEVAHRLQTVESINKFACLEFFDSIEQDFSCHGCTCEADSFQNCDLATIQLDFACHAGILAANRAVSSELFLEPLLCVFLQPIPQSVQATIDFTACSPQFLAR